MTYIFHHYMHISTIFLHIRHVIKICRITEICRVIDIRRVIEIGVLFSVGRKLLEGFEERDSEFVNFERQLEVC